MIYLASASPRRQELLRQLGIAFEAMPSNLVEIPRAGERPEDYVLRVARAKAQHVTRQVRARGLTPCPVLGADTEVVLEGEILGKPRDAQQGQAMLRKLAGRTHEVLTGLVLLHQDAEYKTINRSHVTFGPLTDADIRRYWDSGEPADKAGGYAVQGQAAAFIQRIEGSYSGIMGLPLFELMQLLQQVGVHRT
ncbi:MAG: septum formation inhibitor Maf [Gammaproteobacteria bacterium]|nr:septum formation inhibitor Maf [Gammaproteobacteria bacterium]